MATPPFVSRRELDAAIARIHWRHGRIDDPRRAALGTDPRDVLEYLLRERHAVGVPQWVEAADIQDCLILCTWLWWEDRRRERALLRRGLRRGLTLGELGAPLGIATAQGVRDRLDRLDALLAHHHPDEQLNRETRRLAAAQDPRQHWIDTHRDRVRATISELLSQLDRVHSPATGSPHTPGPRSDAAGEPATGWVGAVSGVESREAESDGKPPRAPWAAAEVARTDLSADSSDELADEEFADEEFAADEDSWIDDLRENLTNAKPTPATLSLLGLALPAAQRVARQARINPPHGLIRAIRSAHQLRADYTRGTTEPPTANPADNPHTSSNTTDLSRRHGRRGSPGPSPAS